MLKQSLWAIIAVFAGLSILDFLLHGVLLKSTYQATAELWRSENEMKMSLMSFVTFIFSICFVLIYSYFITPKSLRAGVLYGALFGLATGISMGFGSYCYLPISLCLAFSWFMGSLIEMTVAGIIVGYIVKPTEE